MTRFVDRTLTDAADQSHQSRRGQSITSSQSLTSIASSRIDGWNIVMIGTRNPCTKNATDSNSDKSQVCLISSVHAITSPSTEKTTFIYAKPRRDLNEHTCFSRSSQPIYRSRICSFSLNSIGIETVLPKEWADTIYPVYLLIWSEHSTGSNWLALGRQQSRCM